MPALTPAVPRRAAPWHPRAAGTAARATARATPRAAPRDAARAALRTVARRVLTGAVAAAALALLAGPAAAQNLQTLYDAARAYDATLQSARTQAESTLYKADQARAARLPTVNAVAGGSFARTEAPWGSAPLTTSISHNAGLSATQLIFNRSTDKTISQAERGIEVANAQLQAAEQDLMVRVTQAYFDVLTASDALGTVRANKAAITEQLASAKRNFEVGTATITDTREAEARFDLARAQELAAENDLNTARLALDQLVGRSGVSPQPLAVPVALPRLEPDDVDEWVRRAEGYSPTLKQLQLALEVAKLETEKARAARLPTVGMTGSVTMVNTRVEGETVVSGRNVAYGANYGTGPAASVGIQVTMPLFSGGAIEGRIKEATALETKARSDLEASRRTLTSGTRTAFFGVKSLTARVAALEAAESSSKLALEATQLGYKVGVRVNLDVLNAQSQLNQAQRDLAKARYDLLVNSLKLRQAAGVLQPQDIAAVNGLLAP